MALGSSQCGDSSTPFLLFPRVSGTHFAVLPMDICIAPAKVCYSIFFTSLAELLTKVVHRGCSEIE